MARSKVILKFTSKETEQLLSFSNMVGMDLDTLCKRAVMYAMNDTIRRATIIDKRKREEEELNAEKSGDISEGGDIARDLEQVPAGEGIDSNSLPNT